jgi:hypothetical protein
MKPEKTPSKEQVVLSKAVIRTAQLLEIPIKVLSSVLSISQANADRLMRNDYALSRSRKEWEIGCLLVRMFRTLDSIAGKMAKEWMHDENAAFYGRSPLNVIQTAAGLVDVFRYLDAHCELPISTLETEVFPEQGLFQKTPSTVGNPEGRSASASKCSTTVRDDMPA